MRTGKEVAQIYIDKYFKAYKGVADFIKNQRRKGHKQGYVTNIIGRKRRLKDINSRDFEKVAYYERLSVNSVVQGCLDFNTKVLVENLGLISIGKLPKNTPLKIYDGEKFVNAWCAESGMKKKVIIKCNDEREIVCSPDHKFLTISTRGIKNWKTAKEFGKREMLVLNQNIIEPFSYISKNDFPELRFKPNFSDVNGVANLKKLNFDVMLQDEFALGYFLGLLKTDGSFSEKNVCFTVAENKKEISDYILPLIEKYFGNYTTYVREPTENRTEKLYKYTINSATLGRQLVDLDLKNKVPELVLKSSECMRGFLSAFFDTDSAVYEEGLVQFIFGKVDKYREYAETIQQILSVFGIHSTVRTYKDRTVVNLRKKSMIKVKNILDSKRPSRYDKLCKIAEEIEHRKESMYRECVWVNKENVIFTDEEIPMFDIIDSDSHKFMANGVITHNSSGDLVASAQNRIDTDERLESKGVYMLLQIHDECVFECPEEHLEEATKKIKHYMENPFGDNVKLNLDFIAESDFGDNYFEAK